MNNIERVIFKVSQFIRQLLRRYLWVKLLVCSFFFICIIKIMSQSSTKLPTIPQNTKTPALKTWYEYYNVVSGHSNAGLDDNNPSLFKLNGKDVLITSGTIHYFRVHPNYWRDRLRKLRAMGAVAVETYVPWNLHEPEMDVFDFGDKDYEMSKFLDIVKFFTIAKEEDLFVILRPGPYICAEWEFGGLPSYLLRLGAKLRTSDLKYMVRVEMYLKELIQRIAPLQIYNGGPIIMVQIENEYGTLNDFDHKYMVELKKIMVEQGLKGLFFTADSPVPYGSRGSLVEEGVLQTANFKLEGQMQLQMLKELQPHKPPMVMEFWTGWFDHWDELVHNTWNINEYITALKEVLAFPASINLYVFHGGTTFGFLNGANLNGDGSPDSYHPDTTSYDYDALVTESGDYTEKYILTQKLFLSLYHTLGIHHPKPPEAQARVLTLSSPITHELSWTQIMNQLPSHALQSYDSFLYMEDLPHTPATAQGFGFVRYIQSILVHNTDIKLQIVGPIRDIVIVLLDRVRQTDVLKTPSQLNDFGFWDSRNESLHMKTTPGLHTIEYFVENCGRVNYAKSLGTFPKNKGLGPDNFVVFEGAEVTGNVEAHLLPFSSKWVSSLAGWKQASQPGEIKAPGLFRTTFTIASEHLLTDTYLDIRRWMKGVVYVNGFNIGRYFSGGPQLTMYIPAPLLRVGENTIIVFDQYYNAGEISLVTEPNFVYTDGKQTW